MSQWSLGEVTSERANRRSGCNILFLAHRHNVVVVVISGRIGEHGGLLARNLGHCRCALRHRRDIHRTPHLSQVAPSLQPGGRVLDKTRRHPSLLRSESFPWQEAHRSPALERPVAAQCHHFESSSARFKRGEATREARLRCSFRSRRFFHTAVYAELYPGMMPASRV